MFSIKLVRRLGFIAAISTALCASNVSTADDTAECEVRRGETLFQKCTTCHTLSQDRRHRVGPNLFGIVGKPVGKQEGYKYSKELRNSSAVWTEEALDSFLSNPRSVYPRTTMGFAGLKKSNDRKDIICHLNSV